MVRWKDKTLMEKVESNYFLIKLLIVGFSATAFSELMKVLMLWLRR